MRAAGEALVRFFAGGDGNLYRYAGHQTTTFIDPSGLEDISTVDIVLGDGLPGSPLPPISSWPPQQLPISIPPPPLIWPKPFDFIEDRSAYWENLPPFVDDFELERQERIRNSRPFHQPSTLTLGIDGILTAAGGPIGKGVKWVGGKALGALGRLVGSTTDDAVRAAGEAAERYLGEGFRNIKNKAGDTVFVSKDGTRRVRFDINRPAPHKNPHMHIDKLR